MSKSNPMNAEYRKRVKKVRAAIKGNYPKIAKQTEFSIDTVRSVMSLRLRNDEILIAAEAYAMHLENFPANA